MECVAHGFETKSLTSFGEHIRNINFDTLEVGLVLGLARIVFGLTSTLEGMRKAFDHQDRPKIASGSFSSRETLVVLW